MRSLFILSHAGGYGGAERSIEVLVSEAPPDVAITVFASNPEHLAQLEQRRDAGAPIDIVRLLPRDSSTAIRFNALRFVLRYRQAPPDRLLVNTQWGAMVAAVAARVLPDLGHTTTLFVHDFLWQSLGHIFARLAGASVMVPDAVVLERVGYLYPHFVPDPAAPGTSVVPGMVTPPDVTPSYDGPILHLASLNRFKGHTDLVLATHRAQARGAVAPVVSMGMDDSGPLHHDLLRLVARLGLTEEQYQLLPYRSDPLPLLARCRAVIVPSVSHHGGPETFCRAMLEGWSCRKPVIAYAAGAPGRIIEHGVDGLLVREGDVAGLAAAMLQLSADEPLARRLGEAGYRKAVAQFGTREVASRFYATLGLGPGSTGGSGSA